MSTSRKKVPKTKSTQKPAPKSSRRHSLSDRRVLWLFTQGYYVIPDLEADKPQVYSVKIHRGIDSNNGRKRTTCVRKTARATKPLSVDYCHRGYRHVRLWYKQKRRSIAIHKLVYMVGHNTVIPRGHEIHHQRGKSLDSLRFLELIDKDTHSDLHTEEFLNGSTYPQREPYKQTTTYPSSWDEF